MCIEKNRLLQLHHFLLKLWALQPPRGEAANKQKNNINLLEYVCAINSAQQQNHAMLNGREKKILCIWN